MKKLCVLIGSLIIVFSLSGCTIGELNKFPPSAIDEEYIKDSVSKGSNIADLTLEYFENVMIELGIKIPTKGEVLDKVDDISDNLPTANDISTGINDNLPTKGEIMNKADEISNNLPTAGEISNGVTGVLPSEDEIKDNVWSASEKLDKDLKEVVK